MGMIFFAVACMAGVVCVAAVGAASSPRLKPIFTKRHREHREEPSCFAFLFVSVSLCEFVPCRGEDAAPTWSLRNLHFAMRQAPHIGRQHVHLAFAEELAVGRHLVVAAAWYGLDAGRL